MIKRIEVNSIVDLFIEYTKINTTGVPDNSRLPSCDNQYLLAKKVAGQFADDNNITVQMQDNAITTITLAASNPVLPSIVFFAHLDTAPDHTGDTHAVRVPEYDGGDISLGHSGCVLSPDIYPEMTAYVGQMLIVTDGTSLLGADDKAAIAAGVEALRYMSAHPEFSHGEIKLVLLPDEETGIRGAKALDVSALNADFGVCLDCCGMGEYVVENWYAGSATVTFTGVTAHPMSAKGKLVNALYMANEFINVLPQQERPENTEGREGYFWVNALSGDTAHATLNIAVRDFESEGYQTRKTLLSSITEEHQKKYGTEKIILNITDIYDNVKDGLDKKPEVLEYVQKAMLNLGIMPRPLIMRGGYDGSVITPRGLPTVNIFTGAHNFHSVNEFLPVESLRLASEMLLEIVLLSGEGASK